MSFIGDGPAAVRIGIFVFVGMILLYIFSLFLKVRELRLPGLLLIWAVVIAFVIFVGMTVSAFAFDRPCNWVNFLSLQNSGCSQPPRPASPRVKLEGTLGHFSTQIQARGAELGWLLHLESPELNNLYVKETTAKTWRDLVAAICRSLSCVECQSSNEQMPDDDITMKLTGGMSDFSIEGVSHKRCGG